MVVCRNWDGRPGSCRFGDRCRFEHPEHVRSSNPFAPLQRDTSTNKNSYENERTLPYQLDRNQIITDLTTERPQWILSAYGPGRNAPEQLFGGPVREQSFEEMRVLHYLGMRSGNPQQAAQEADKLIQASEQQIQVALSNIDGAIAYILEAKDKHPNRIDIVQQSMSGTQQNNNAFARGTNSNSFQAANTTSNAFGVPNQQPTTSAFGAPSQPATTSAFGAPSTGSTSGAFGQRSALGSRPNPFAAPAQSAFGKPAFGASSQPGAGGAFGQPSALGQKSNAFGAPSGGGFSAFANAGTTFGLPSQPATTSAFGQPSQNKSSNAFGAPSQPAPSNPFGAPSAAANPFSGASSTPFGAPSPASKNPFGVPSSQAPAANPFGGSAPKANPFASAPVAAANPFGNPQPNPPAASNPFGRQPNGPIADASPFGNPVSNSALSYQPITTGNSTQHPPLESYVTFGPNGTLATFKGKRVVYKNGLPGFVREDKTWERIWFPEGPPQLNKDTEMEDSAYDEETKAAYMYVRQHGKFKDGVMPLLPPKREWVLWDF